MNPDLTALQVALERQAEVLAPIAHRLRLGVVHPPVAPHDWSGPASVTFAEREVTLRQLIRHAAEAAETALHETRLALSQVGHLQAVRVPDV